MYSLLLKMLKKMDILKHFESTPNFVKQQNEVVKEALFKKKFTIVFDIMNVFLTELYIQNEDDLELVEQIENKDKNLIVIKKHLAFCDEENCIHPKINNECISKLRIFLVRPYTHELISAIYPFFELIAYSNLPFTEISQILDTIEGYLNKPLMQKN